MNELPEMTVELRESTTAHSVPPPDLSDVPGEIRDAVYLNQAANKGGWDRGALELLAANIHGGAEASEIAPAIRQVMGFSSWAELSKWVVDDMCVEFFNMALSYCLKEGQAHKEDHGFIDGSGIGYVRAYIERLKVTLEQAFDAKYHYKRPRPLVYALEEMGQDLTKVANAIHPGHWAYPAGHCTKFFTAVEVLRDVFALDKKCSRTLYVAASVAAHSRTGNLIHYLQDNVAGGYLTNLKEFNG